MTSLRAPAALAFLLGGAALPACAGGISEPVMDAEPAPATEMVAPPTIGNWTGAYVGGSLGYSTLDGTSNGLDLFADDISGGSIGIHAGYTRNLGRVVLGGELQYEIPDLQEGDQFLELDSIARAKARIGYDAGVFMPYVSAGVAQASVSDSSFAGDDNGSFAGVGVDYKYGERFIVGAEVLRSQFDDFSAPGIDLDATTASVRMSFSF